MGAGCAGFSLVGLLAVIAIVFWLGGSAFEGSGGGSGAIPTNAGASTTTIPSVGVAIAVDPAIDLADGDVVEVTSDDFPAGTLVRVATCVAGTGRVTNDAPTCDEATTQEATVDRSGRLAVSHGVARVVSVGGIPFDCASEPGRCQIEVRASGAGSGGTDLFGAAPLTFAQGGAVPITLPELSD